MGKIKQLTRAQIDRHRALIDSLGGPTAVATIVFERLDVEMTSQNVSNWRSRGIPSDYRPCLARVAGERNIGVPARFLDSGKPSKPREAQPKDEEVPFL